MKNIYMYVQDTMADWEHGYLGSSELSVVGGI